MPYDTSAAQLLLSVPYDTTAAQLQFSMQHNYSSQCRLYYTSAAQLQFSLTYIHSTACHLQRSTVQSDICSTTTVLIAAQPQFSLQHNYSYGVVRAAQCSLASAAQLQFALHHNYSSHCYTATVLAAAQLQFLLPYSTMQSNTCSTTTVFGAA